MPILNYTTKIKSENTITEIQKILVNHGAKKIMIDYDERGTPSAVTFCLLLDERFVPYSLPCNYGGVLTVMKQDKKIGNSFVNEEQAIRTSWRIVKDWVEAQMAIVEVNLAKVDEVFLPYVITKQGNTLYEYIKSNEGMKILQQTNE